MNPSTRQSSEWRRATPLLIGRAWPALAEQRLGVSVSGAYSARWDLVHDQLLIVRVGAGNGVEVMLMRFAVEDRPPASATSTAP